tara:strand:+ start:371 stop:772 length:402 start_codon:yes stop_codon:yes gene_type:complete
MKSQLLCTFTSQEELQNTLQAIRTKYNIVYNYMYVLQNKSNLEELFVSYNIDTSIKYDSLLEDTILVHRKKEYNTLYTINALNQIVKEQNKGVLDKSFGINWSELKNSIIVSDVDGVKKIFTRIYKVIEFNKK